VCSSLSGSSSTSLYRSSLMVMTGVTPVNI
jgi:hypothetical protein